MLPSSKLDQSRPFFEFWRTRADFIEALEPQSFHEATVLTWAALDALGNLWARCLAAALRNGAGRRRLGEFLARHGGDPFGRVSLPAFWARADRLAPGPMRDRLRAYGGRREPTILQQRELRKWTDDPTLDEVLAQLADVAGERVTGEIRVRDLVLDCRFGEIAYSEMRCSMLHEGRPGRCAHTFDLGTESQTGPTYLSGVYGVSPVVGFSPPYMLAVLRACIDGFEHEADASGVDPVPLVRGCIVLDDLEE